MNFLCMLVGVVFDAVTVHFDVLFHIAELHLCFAVVFLIQLYYKSTILCVFHVNLKIKMSDCSRNAKFLSFAVAMSLCG